LQIDGQQVQYAAAIRHLHFAITPCHRYDRHDRPIYTVLLFQTLSAPPPRTTASYLFMRAIRRFPVRTERRRAIAPVNTPTAMELLR
jgi:hypothetical protein